MLCTLTTLNQEAGRASAAARFLSAGRQNVMELHQIRYLLAVVREGNFSRAAAACNVSQPSITRAIRKLEQELGGVLFERRPNGAALTELGRTLVPRLESVHNELQLAASEAEKHAAARTHRLRLGVMCSIGPLHLIDLVSQVNKRLPELDMTIEEGPAHAIVERLISGDVDVAIACLPRFPEELQAKALFKERYAVAIPAGHRFQKQDSVQFQELVGENYLERLHCEFDDYYAAHFGNQPFELTVKFASEREDWVQALVVAGMGIAILPENLALIDGVLTRPLTEPIVAREISLLTVRGRRHKPAVDAFTRVAASVSWQKRVAKG